MSDARLDDVTVMEHWERKAENELEVKKQQAELRQFKLDSSSPGDSSRGGSKRVGSGSRSNINSDGPLPWTFSLSMARSEVVQMRDRERTARAAAAAVVAAEVAMAAAEADAAANAAADAAAAIVAAAADAAANAAAVAAAEASVKAATAAAVAAAETELNGFTPIEAALTADDAADDNPTADADEEEA
jgi:hypothetical protein